MATGAEKMELHSESPGICCYRRHPCSRPRYQKYKYCVQHILEDTSSPFTSCEYLSRTSGRKCPNPALRSQKVNNSHSLCEEHLRELIVKEQHQKHKRKLRKKRKNGKPVDKNSTSAKRRKLIGHLAKYNKNFNKAPHEDSSDSEVEEVHRPIKDDWPLDPGGLGSNVDWDDFDPVNNEVYEPLRYADVLTPEEVVATAQSKLIRLQSLYIEQFKRLFHLLKERRRQYLHDRKKELSGTQFTDDDDETGELYALATYRKRTGVEALLRKRQLKRRQEAEASTSSFKSSTNLSRCSHISNHTRCKEYCLPYTKYCSLHILSDPHQQLYKKCHFELCQNPVCILTARVYQSGVKVQDDTPEEIYFCLLHMPLPEFSFVFPKHVKQDEDDEMVVDVENPGEVDDKAERQQSEKMEGMDPPRKFEMEGSEETLSIGKGEDFIGTENEVDAKQIQTTGKPSPIHTVPVVPYASGPGEVGTVELDKYRDTKTESGTFLDASEVSDSMLIRTSDTMVRLAEQECPKKEEIPVEKSSPGGATATNDCEGGSSNSKSTDIVTSATVDDSVCKDSQSFVGSDADGSATECSTEKPTNTTKPGTHSSCASVDDKSDSAPSVHCHSSGVAMARGDTVKDSEGLDLAKDSGKKDVADLGAQASERLDEAAPVSRPVTSGGLEDPIRSPPRKPDYARLSAVESPIRPVRYLGSRGERKPSSAEEELAVVSLLSLRSGHPSDDNTTSSSTEPE